MEMKSRYDPDIEKAEDDLRFLQKRRDEVRCVCGHTWAEHNPKEPSRQRGWCAINSCRCLTGFVEATTPVEQPRWNEVLMELHAIREILEKEKIDE